MAKNKYFELKEVPTYKIKLVNLLGEMITQAMFTANQTKYQQADLYKYSFLGSTNIQYIPCKLRSDN